MSEFFIAQRMAEQERKLRIKKLNSPIVLPPPPDPEGTNVNGQTYDEFLESFDPPKAMSDATLDRKLRLALDSPRADAVHHWMTTEVPTGLVQWAVPQEDQQPPTSVMREQISPFRQRKRLPIPPNQNPLAQAYAKKFNRPPEEFFDLRFDNMFLRLNEEPEKPLGSFLYQQAVSVANTVLQAPLKIAEGGLRLVETGVAGRQALPRHNLPIPQAGPELGIEEARFLRENFKQMPEGIDPSASSDIRNWAAYEAIVRMRRWLDKHYEGDPRRAEELWSTVIPAGVADIAVFAAGGLAAAAVKLAPWMGTLAVASFLSGQATAEEAALAQEQGKTDANGVRLSFLEAMGLGPLEMLPVQRMFSRFNKGSGGKLVQAIWRGIKDVGIGTIEEAATEALQGVGANKIAKDIYDPNRDLMEGIWAQGGTGGIIGFIANAVAVAGGFRRRRAAAQLLDDMATAGQQVEDIDVGQIADAMLEQHGAVTDSDKAELKGAIRETIAARNQLKAAQNPEGVVPQDLVENIVRLQANSTERLDDPKARKEFEEFVRDQTLTPFGAAKIKQRFPETAEALMALEGPTVARKPFARIMEGVFPGLSAATFNTDQRTRLRDLFRAPQPIDPDAPPQTPTLGDPTQVAQVSPELARDVADEIGLRLGQAITFNAATGEFRDEAGVLPQKAIDSVANDLRRDGQPVPYQTPDPTVEGDVNRQTAALLSSRLGQPVVYDPFTNWFNDPSGALPERLVESIRQEVRDADQAVAAPSERRPIERVTRNAIVDRARELGVEPGRRSMADLLTLIREAESRLAESNTPQAPVREPVVLNNAEAEPAVTPAVTAPPIEQAISFPGNFRDYAEFRGFQLDDADAPNFLTPAEAEKLRPQFDLAKEGVTAPVTKSVIGASRPVPPSTPETAPGPPELSLSVIPAETRKPEPEAPRVATIHKGDSVQFTSQGVAQFATPRKVTGISPDGTQVFVEGTGTGLPIGEVTLALPIALGTTITDAEIDDAIREPAPPEPTAQAQLDAFLQKKRVAGQQVLPEDVEFQRLSAAAKRAASTASSNETRAQNAELRTSAAQRRDQGLVDEDVIRFTSVARLPSTLRTLVQDEAAFLLGTTKGKASRDALKTIVEAADDSGSAVEEQKRRIVDRLIGRKDSRSTAERFHDTPERDPSPIMAFFLDQNPERRSRRVAEAINEAENETTLSPTGLAKDVDQLLQRQHGVPFVIESEVVDALREMEQSVQSPVQVQGREIPKNLIGEPDIEGQTGAQGELPLVEQPLTPEQAQARLDRENAETGQGELFEGGPEAAEAGFGGPTGGPPAPRGRVALELDAESLPDTVSQGQRISPRGLVRTLLRTNPAFQANPVFTVDQDGRLRFDSRDGIVRFTREQLGVGGVDAEPGDLFPVNSVSFGFPAATATASEVADVASFDPSNASELESTEDLPVESSHPIMFRMPIHRLPLDFSVELARQLMGKVPTVRRLRKGRLGVFRADDFGGVDILIDPAAAATPLQLAKVLHHEIGHIIDYFPDKTLARGNIVGRLKKLRKFMRSTFGANGPTNAALREELIALEEWWKPYDKASAPKAFIKYRESSRELYADAMSVMLTAPSSLKRRAPLFWSQLQDNLQRNPDVLQEYLDLQFTLGLGNEATAKRSREFVQRSFERGGDQIIATATALQAGRENAAETMRQRLERSFIDMTKPGKDIILGTTSIWQGTDEQLEAVAALDDLFHVGGPVQAAMNEISEHIEKPLREADISIAEIGEYLVYNRVIDERGEIANPTGQIPETSLRNLENMRNELGDEKFELLDRTMKRWHREIIFDAAREAHKSGLISTEVFEGEIVRNMDSYAAFIVAEHIDNPNRIPAGVFHQSGTFKDIVNAFQGTNMKLVSMIRATKANNARRTLIEQMLEKRPDLLQEVRRRRGADGKDGGPARKANSGFGLVTFMEQGKARTFEVPQQLADIFRAHDTTQAQALGRILSSATYKTFHPILVTYNPAFALRNVSRDIRRTWVNLTSLNSTLGRLRADDLRAEGLSEQEIREQNKAEKISFGTVVHYYLRSLPAGLRRARGIFDEDVQRLLKEGILDVPYTDIAAESGEIVVPDLPGGPKTERRSEKMRRARFFLTRWMGHAMTVIRVAGETSETASKIGGERILRDRGVAPARRKMITRKVVGTPDFGQEAHLTQITNSLSLYQKVRTNGWQSTASLAFRKETAGAWWSRQLITVVLGTALTKAAQEGLFGPWLKRIYELIPSYFVDNYDILPLGTYLDTDGLEKAIFLTIPMSDEQRTLSGLMARAIDVGIAKKKGFSRQGTAGDAATEGFRELFGDIVGTANPAIAIPWKWAQFAMGRNPYDAFFGKQVVPRLQWEMGGWEATKKMAGWTADQFGVVSSIAHAVTGPVLGQPFSEDKETTVQTTIRSFPVVNAFLRSSNQGEREEAAGLFKMLDQEEAKLRGRLPSNARRAAREFYVLNRLTKASKLEPAEEIRRVRVNAWYNRVYLKFTKAIRETHEAGMVDQAQQLRDQLERLTKEMFPRF